MNYALTVPNLAGVAVTDASPDVHAQMPSVGEQAPATHQYLQQVMGMVSKLRDEQAQQAQKPQSPGSTNPYAMDNPQNPYAVVPQGQQGQGPYGALLQHFMPNA